MDEPGGESDIGREDVYVKEGRVWNEAGSVRRTREAYLMSSL